MSRESERMDRLGALIREVERDEQPNARERTRAIVSLLLEMHRAGLERLVAAVAGSDADAFADSVDADEALRSLLLLHDLHPRSLRARVEDACRRLSETLAKRGLTCLVLECHEGRIRVAIDGRGGDALQSMVEEALVEAAPDASAIAIDVRDPTTLVPVERLSARRAAGAG